MQIELYNTIEKLIFRSNNLLEKEIINQSEFENHKKDCVAFYYLLIRKDINETITELAEGGLKLEIKKIEGKINQILYNFWNWRDSISFQIPFLLKHTDSDYYKKYIFWTKNKLEGIDYNLKLNHI